MDTEPPDLGLLSHSFLAIVFDWTNLVLILILILLLLFSALISGSEVAYFSLTANDLDQLKKDDSKKGDLIIELKNKPRSLLATILISNNFINVAIIVVSYFLISNIFDENMMSNFALWLKEQLNLVNSSINAISIVINFIITVLGVTFLLVLFGEVLPKIYANMNRLGFAKFMADPLNLLMFIFGIFSKVLVHWSNKIERRVERHRSVTRSMIKDDIDKAIDLTVSKEANAAEEADILKGILKFSDVMVKQIMTPRMDVITADTQTDFKSLIQIVKESGYSRIPVFNEDLDNIEGILYVKDLLAHTSKEGNYKWQIHLRKDVLYVPESKKINELLKEFQSKRLHIAIVVDEYGGTSGIVTLEDVMEEIIGDIRDEFDEEIEIEFLKLDDKNYIFEGKTLLNDVCRVIGIDTKTFDKIKGESDSLAGLFLEVTGKFPKVDSELDLDKFKFKIVSVTNRRIEKIHITVKQ